MRFPFDTCVKATSFGVKSDIWKCGYHSGVDYQSKKYGGNGLIYPILDGKVIAIKKGGSYGNHILVKHKNGYISLYSHLERFLVKQGDIVYEENPIGIEGTTGHSNAIHLHLEIHKGAYSYPSKIDPNKFIKKEIEKMKEVNIKLKINGKIKQCNAISKDGYNYLKLQDLRSDGIDINYKDGFPIINTKGDV